MDFAFTQSMTDVAGLARQIFTDHPRDAGPHLVAAGLLEVGWLEMCVLLEEQGRAGADAPLWVTLAARLALPEQPAGLTAALADEAAATLDGNRVSGVRNQVHLAERVLVPAGSALVAVDPRGPGATVEAQLVTTGETLHRLTLDRAPVLSVAPVGVDWLRPRATVLLCALQLGIAERALAMTARYTATRQQFERPIATFQAVAQRAADAAIAVETMRLTMWQAAWRLDQGAGRDAEAAVALAAFTAAEAGHRVVYAAQHLHGGIGFDASYPLGRCWLWAKHNELLLGPADAQLARLGAILARSSE
jgi:alkylation response protein AidB-like acyl-CoA dehydrogenase